LSGVDVMVFERGGGHGIRAGWHIRQVLVL